MTRNEVCHAPLHWLKLYLRKLAALKFHVPQRPAIFGTSFQCKQTSTDADGSLI